MSVLRLDKIDDLVSGNKWFKLRCYIEDARQQEKKRVVTFGGAYSNHILATAAVAKRNGFSSAGIIRGEEPSNFSPTLLDAKELGMQLYFARREQYRDNYIPQELKTDESYFINEGGYGAKGAEGAITILNYCSKDFTHCCCAVGTGTMLAGLSMGISSEQHLVGIPVIKLRTLDGNALEASIQSLLDNNSKDWKLIYEYHFGGYAKYNAGLIGFMNQFFQQTTIPLDFVYTGKLFYAINDLINNNYFPPGSKLLLIHSGGLQGNRSLPKGTLIY